MDLPVVAPTYCTQLSCPPITTPAAHVQCGKYELLRSGPSARHSAVDWTTPEGINAVGNAAAVEVVLDAGDVLYIPAFWLHFIVGMSSNAQCSFRGGTPYSPDIDVIGECGFSYGDAVNEAPGEFCDVSAPPLSHALVTALDGIDVAAAPVIPFPTVLALHRVLARAGAGGWR